MGNLIFLPISDYRNEGWGFAGSGVDKCWKAWNNDDDSKYCFNPHYKGRATVRFPIDTTDIPEGAIITSVTVFARVARVGSTSRSITFNMVSHRNPSRYTSRSIYPSTTIKTYEIGTYQCDPEGRSWDRSRLNYLMLQAFSYCNSQGAVRVYKLWAVVNYRVRPSVVVDSPTGTVVTPTPTVTWTYTHDDGDEQKKATFKIFTAVQQAASNFNPETSPFIVKDSVNGDITSKVIQTALAPNSYYVYVQAESKFKSKTPWVGRAFSVQGVAPGIPGGQSEPGGPGGGAGFVSVVADPYTASAYLMLRDGSNLLPVQAADLETSTDGHGYTGTNCTADRDTTTFYSAGGGSLKMTASSAGDMSATSSYVRAAASTPLTGSAQFKSAVTGRTCQVEVEFLDQDFTVINSVTGTGTDTTGSWQTVTATGTSPADTEWVRTRLTVQAAATSEVHWADAIGLMYGTNSVWSHGGHMSRNLLSAAASNAEPATNQPVEPWKTSNLATTYQRVVTSGTGSDGSQKFQLTYTGVSPTIAFVAAGSAYTATDTSSGYTLNKPAGVIDNDLLIAFITAVEHTSSPIEVPTGWTKVTTASLNNGNDDIVMHVLKRTGLTADPATWIGNLGSSSDRRRAVVFAYRGCAPASQQFLAENITTSASGTTAITSATLNNTDPNAWRLAAFAARDNVTGGTMQANVQAPVAAYEPQIIFVGKSGSWSTTSTNLNYTINKPSGVQSGDLMIASAVFSGQQTTVTPPTGWTLVRKTTSLMGDGDEHSGSVTMAVLKRVAGSSEPNSWTGTHSNPGKPKISQTLAYRNCDASQFIAEAESVGSGSCKITTGSVTNTDSRAWRVSIFAATSPYDNDVDHSTEAIQRSDSTTDLSGFPDVCIATYDSNKAVPTGSYTRQGTFDDDPFRTVSWIGLLRPLPIVSPPSPPAFETERSDGTTGAADPWLTLGVYDTAAPAPLGLQSVTGWFTPGSGTSIDSAASWIGLIKQASPIVAGEAEMELVSPVDISDIDPYVLSLAGNKVTLLASFQGSSAGVPYLSLYFYNANELLQVQTLEGQAYDSTTWTQSAITVDIPTGTTRIGARLKTVGRAASDSLGIDRISMSFGTSTVYRAGTGRDTHPVWSLPLIEYADDFGDGYGPWKPLPATSEARLLYDQLNGLTQFIDQTIVPQASRKYRARTLSYGLAGDQFMSPYGPESEEVVGVTVNWWLKDLSDPANSMELKVKFDPLDVGTTNSASVFQPLGADLPIVVSEGYKGDVVTITAIVGHSEYAHLQKLLKLGKTLYLQSNIDNAWWVRPVGDLQVQTQPTSKRSRDTNPLRFVQISFVQVAPVA